MCFALAKLCPVNIALTELCPAMLCAVKLWIRPKSRDDTNTGD
jgi:hypothetical protein